MPRVAVALDRSFTLCNFLSRVLFLANLLHLFSHWSTLKIFEIYLSTFPSMGLFSTFFAMLFRGFGLSVYFKI